ncbi:unannotated protein [freshwater metagenome]|uniref:Unannotated protein n=1 Tax=freshwater metagenome TaxID=449393 RepID=A0A6J5Z8U2_9ZZZZ
MRESLRRPVAVADTSSTERTRRPTLLPAATLPRLAEAAFFAAS